MPVTPPDPLSIANILAQILAMAGLGSVVLPKVLQRPQRARRRR